MLGCDLQHLRWIKERGVPEVSSFAKDSPVSIFSTEIFGVTEQEQTTRFAVINLHTSIVRPIYVDLFKRINRNIHASLTRGVTICIDKDSNIRQVEKSYQAQEGEVVGAGPTFFYHNWDKLKLTEKLESAGGKYTNAEMRKTFAHKGRDSFFTSYQMVSPLGFRQEQDEESSMVFNDENKFYSDIIKYSNILKESSTSDGFLFNKVHLECAIQDQVCKLFDYCNDRYLGPHGAFRRKGLSRIVDHSGRSTIIHNVYEGDILGVAPVSGTVTGIPIQQLVNEFRDTFIKFSKDLIEALYAEGYFEDTEHNKLMVYDNEYLNEFYDHFKDQQERLKPFLRINANNEWVPLKIAVEVLNDKGEVVENVVKELSNLEFAYICAMTFIDIQRTRALAVTRYPTDSALSTQTLFIYPLTLLKIHTKKCRVMGVDYDRYPFVSEDMKGKYKEKIFETAQRINASTATGFNGDFDGDSCSHKPINSKEAVAEVHRIQNNALFNFDFSGNYRRNLAKSPGQCVWTFTRDPKEKELKLVKDATNSEFVKYILSVEDSKIDRRVVFKNLATYGKNKQPLHSLYDNVTIKYRGKKIDTTIGRLLFNKIVFSRVWEHPSWDFVNTTVKGKDIPKLFKKLLYMQLENELKGEDINRMNDMYAEFCFRFSQVFSASIGLDMSITDDTFRKKKNEIMNRNRDKIEAGDIEALTQAEKEAIAFADDYYKETEMHELYESGCKASWTGDFKLMQISLGAFPSFTGGKPTMIVESLSDKIPVSKYPASVNTAMFGAYARGRDTALGGAMNKLMTESMSTILGVKGDCGSKHGVEVVATDPQTIMYRSVINKDGSLTLITSKNVDKYLNKKITIRDPRHCIMKGDKFCSTCVGEMPFRMTNSDKINLGSFTAEISSNVLNLFMKATHKLQQEVRRIGDLNDYVYPKPKTPLFYVAHDPVDNVDKIYTYKDLTWYIPESAVTAENTSYSVLAHGSIIETDTGEQYSFILGTEVSTSPSEVLPASSKNNNVEKHAVLKYFAHTPILNDNLTLVKGETVYKFLNMFLNGNVSNLVPLNTHLSTLKNSFKFNEDIGATDLMLSIILFTLARDAKDLTKPARETGTEDYRFVALNDITTMGGTFSSLMGQDAVRGLAVAINKNEKDQEVKTTLAERAFLVKTKTGDEDIARIK